MAMEARAVHSSAGWTTEPWSRPKKARMCRWWVSSEEVVGAPSAMLVAKASTPTSRTLNATAARSSRLVGRRKMSRTTMRATSSIGTTASIQAIAPHSTAIGAGTRAVAAPTCRIVVWSSGTVAKAIGRAAAMNGASSHHSR